MLLIPRIMILQDVLGEIKLFNRLFTMWLKFKYLSDLNPLSTSSLSVVATIMLPQPLIIFSQCFLSIQNL
jgi:hypothetical protein